MEEPHPVVRISDLTVGFGPRNVLDGLSLDVCRGEILGFVGASGSGKSVLLRTILGLTPKQAGKPPCYLILFYNCSLSFNFTPSHSLSIIL